MEIKAAIDFIKENGRVRIKEGHGSIIELISLDHWSPEKDQYEGIFLFFDLFQIRTVAHQFSEVSLDIIEFATKPTIYHTPVNKILQKGPIEHGNVRFAVLKKDFWNKLLFAYSQPLILQYRKTQEFDFETKEFFPLLSAGTKEMFLSPEGDIKIHKS
ncbi:hypothetical protein [Cecembia lonarensis]|uniref:Uncharacterized protein n=1 Tax=Cecembia lonarensis (strain CCUG 58316 / KCTC 22772 / LW9) TaxID=1225176 RepID=K1LDH3_CECL9|nr:hypothetical protein [Cecembia lonarensis]EKB48423.1 hypothetical protein B879_02948 [Cecembia lonarensis LW9]